MEDYRVIIPEEHYQLVNFTQEGLPGVMVLNSALKEFEPKEVFAWHLSIMLQFQDLIENGMPSKSEREIVEPYEDSLELAIKGDEPEKPNALFFARITWNKTREYIYRVYDPKDVDALLKTHISSKEYPREFDYRMDHDPPWKRGEWHLNTLNAQQDAGHES